MTTNEPPPYPGDSEPGATPPPPGPGEPPASEPPSYGSAPPPAGETPPPPPPPPPAPGGSAEGFSAPEAIGWGWRKFTENVGPLLLAMLILVVTLIVVNIVVSIITPGSTMMGGSGTVVDFDAGDFLWSLVASIVLSGALYVIAVAISRGALDVADGQKFDFMQAFGRINVVNALVAGVILGALETIGYALFFLPGLIVSFFAYFTAYFVAEGSSAVDAIKESFSLVGENIGNSLVLAILSVLVIVAGVIALLVGVLVAVPVTVLAGAYAFRSFRGQPVAA